MHDVRPIEVSYTAVTKPVTVYIEDSDTDQDWFPDAYEYELNRSASNFLELTGPNDAWSYRGDGEYNPTLDASGFINMVFAMASGSPAQQAEIINNKPQQNGALTEEQLISVFSTGEKVERTPRGSKPPSQESLPQSTSKGKKKKGGRQKKHKR
jgi:hypothetical protein